MEVESGKDTSHSEKDPADRSVEGDKQPTLAREPGTSKEKTLHRDESEQGGQRSDSKYSQASRKKGDRKGKEISLD